MKAADLFVRCLESEGVEYLFTVPGEENLDLLEALRNSHIRVILNRHEQGSAFMAATYGRLTGKIGVCMATLGPGATNLVTGVAHAQLAGVPLLAITGQKGIRRDRDAAFQLIDVVDMMRPITKSTVQIQGPLAIPKEIRHAVKTALSERQGASHIELPEDVAQEEVPDDVVAFTPGDVHQPCADQHAVHLAAERIRAARHPIMIVSSRTQHSNIHAALRRFCEATNIHVIHTQLGKGGLGDDHPNSLFAFGIHRHDYVNCVVDEADLIVTVGYSTREYPPRLWHPENDKQIVHIDFVPAQTGVHYNPSVEVIGDITAALHALEHALEGFRYTRGDLAAVRRELMQRLFEEGADDPAFPPRPRRIVAECRRVLGRGDIICLDNGIYKLWFARHYPTYEVNTFLLDNALATMGAGLPSAMAAKFVHPEKRVLGVIGDGGFMMNSQELETAVRLRIPVVVLLLVDDAYGFIQWKQASMGFPAFALDFGNPDFVAYARSYGAEAYAVTATNELGSTLEQAFAADRPAIVVCPIDYSENVPVWDRELERIDCRMH